MATERLYKTHDVAQILGMTDEDVRRLCRRGDIAALRVCVRGTGQRPRYRISPEAVTNYLAALRRAEDERVAGMYEAMSKRKRTRARPVSYGPSFCD